MRQHVDHLFLDSMHGLVELAWTDPDDGAPKHAQLFGLDRLDELVEKAVALNGERRNVYIGAALRKETTPPFGRSNGVDFLAATAVWSDLDDPGGTVRAAEVYKQLGTLADPCRRHRRHAAPARAAVVETGRTGARGDGGQGAAGRRAASAGRRRCRRRSRPDHAARRHRVAWPAKSGRVAELTQVLLFRDRPAYGVATARRSVPAGKGAPSPGSTSASSKASTSTS